MSSSAGPITLPTWYACFPATSLPALPDGTRRVGPLAIVRPAEGVDITTFGRADDPGVVLFDGYLFERRALRVSLELDGGSTDAQIAAAAYAQWGEAVFDRLDGSYLLAIWDPRAFRLLLGHDALGHHPAYYTTASGTLLFGTNVLAIAHSGYVSRRVNRVSLVLSALTKWPAQGQTFFEDIRRLTPGRFLRIAPDLSTHEHTYFSPWLEDGEPDMTAAQVREQFEPALTDAVSRCMELDPEGIMLSGGLDSVTIAALAAEYSTEHGTPLITAVSGRSGGASVPGGEEPMQTATTSALGMRHILMMEDEWTGGQNDIEMSLDVVPELPAPSRIYWVGSYMAFYRRTAAQQVRVLLTGSGGDNWVAVGNAYAAESMRRLRLRQLARFVRSYTDTGGLSTRAAAETLLWSGGVRVLLDAWAAKLMPGVKSQYHRRRAGAALPDWLCPDLELREAVRDTLLAQRPASLTDNGKVPASFYRHEQRSVVNPYFVYEFELGSHIESACGLRLLSPYHDRRLVRFLNAVPAQVLLDGARYKGLLRPVADRRLPALDLGSQRKVYGPGVVDAHRRNLWQGVAAAWPKLRDFPRLAALGVVDPKGASTHFDLTREMVSTEPVEMYTLMSAERWIAHHAGA